MVVVISIEGNVGSGKSTLLEAITKLHFTASHTIVLEDVKGWTNISDSSSQNILEKYYQDPTKYSFAFQTLVLMSRLRDIETAIQTGAQIIFLERSDLTDKFIFAKNLKDQDKMSEIEWLVYCNIYEKLQHILKYASVNTIIYLKTDPEVCQERIRQRQRKGEDLITLEYLTKLAELHEQWFGEDGVQHVSQNVDTWILNGNFDWKNENARNTVLEHVQFIVNQAYSQTVELP